MFYINTERQDTYLEELMWLKQRFNMNKTGYGKEHAEKELIHDAKDTYFFKDVNVSSILRQIQIIVINVNVFQVFLILLLLPTFCLR